MRNLVRRFIKDETGATAIEYGLIIAVLSLTIVTGVGTLGNKLQYLWGNNNGEIAKGLNSH